MMDFEDLIIAIIGIWISIILFLTCPLWVIPYTIYARLKRWC